MKAITACLECYFKAKNEDGFTETTANDLKDSATLLFAHLVMLYDLKQTLLFETEKRFPRMIKLHLLHHLYDAVKKWGTLIKGNTEHYERNHKVATVSLWETTSKRNASINKEMIQKSILHDYNFTLSYLCQLQDADYSGKWVGRKFENIEYERISNISSCELYYAGDERFETSFPTGSNVREYTDLKTYLQMYCKYLKQEALNLVLVRVICGRKKFESICLL